MRKLIPFLTLLLVLAATGLLAQGPSVVTPVGFSAAAPGPIGSTTPNTGVFTSVSSAATVNNTGLQLFNSTTTCTTAATISTPCTTAAISLPVSYADTNYRVVCTGLGVTQFPQIQTVTKSNTSFTITLNNLTAAAATYTSFDCIVSHN